MSVPTKAALRDVGDRPLLHRDSDTLSRGPLFVGSLGFVSARAGRLDDASGLLCELEDRSSRGEYVLPAALFLIHLGQGDLPAMRRTQSRALTEATPPFVLRFVCAPYIEEFPDDLEIDRLLSEFHGPGNA